MTTTADVVRLGTKVEGDALKEMGGDGEGDRR